MIICSNCNHQQQSGSTCENCGQLIQEINHSEEQHAQAPNENTHTDKSNEVAATVTSQQAESTSNETLDNIKKGLGSYWKFFVELLKNPTKSLQLHDKHLVFSIVSVSLFVLTLSLGYYFTLNTAMGGIFGELEDMLGSFGGYDYGYSGAGEFFNIVLKMILVGAIAFGISYGSLLIIFKTAKLELNPKQLFIQFSSLSIPFLVLNIVVILLGALSVGMLANSLLGGTVQLYLSLVPALLVYDKLTRHPQRIYYGVGTAFLIGAINILINSLLLKHIGLSTNLL